MPNPAPYPDFLRLEQALVPFVDASIETEGAHHIKPLHRYIAMRLVIEGGFPPEDIIPRPPLTITRSGTQRKLRFDNTPIPRSARGEATVIGGLKSKKIDVVVFKPTVGPVLAISVKGTKKAFRNLTNRMEEAIGDSTNLHIMYPGLVYGFLHILQASRAGAPGLLPNDVSINSTGDVTTSLKRYHDVLAGLSGRRLVRDDYTKYEAVGFAIAERTPSSASVFGGYPPFGDTLALETFFETLYQIYDLRYPYMSHRKGLRRLSWLADSQAFQGLNTDESLTSRFGYAPRIGVVDEEDDDDEPDEETGGEPAQAVGQ